MEKLNRRLANNGEEEVGPPRPVEPPVWRLEEDAPRPRRTGEPAVVNRRQRQRDMLIFFVMIAAFIVVLALVLTLAHTHLPGALPGL